MPHSPGPWTLCQTLEGTKVVDFHVAASPHGSFIPICEQGRVKHENMEDNARLIAAAPELLEALIAICDADEIPSDDVWKMAERAIAKALGK